MKRDEEHHSLLDIQELCHFAQPVLLHPHQGCNFPIYHERELGWQAWFTGQKEETRRLDPKGDVQLTAFLFGC